MVINREVSTCVLSCEARPAQLPLATRCSFSANTLMPNALQIARYIGASA
jgi:hypothetical protein